MKVYAFKNDQQGIIEIENSLEAEQTFVGETVRNFLPLTMKKIDVNCQYISHFDTENYNKNGIESHQALVFGQSGGTY